MEFPVKLMFIGEGIGYGDIVLFRNRNEGTVIHSSKKSEIGDEIITDSILPFDETRWKIIEEETDSKHDDSFDAFKCLNGLQNVSVDSKKETRGNGGKTSYYDIPENAMNLGDLIYHKEMNHSIGEAFCALYRLKDNGEYKRNLKKAKYYIEQELKRCDG